jgi:DNA-binding transcriptional ArsR family regulator
MLEIRESQIEDIFATQLDDVQAILSLNERLTLIDRQRKLTSGRIDLLFLSISSLHLLELKAVTSKIEFCEQTIGYRNDLLELQSENKIPNLPLKSYLVCPKFINSHRDYCIKNDIIPIEFSPYELLKNYYFKVKAISSLVTVKPSNHGLWNLHLLNPIIYAIEDKTNIVTLSKITGKSKSTVGSYLRLANELGLIDREFNVTLTTLGKRYVKLKDDKIDRLNDHQVEILKEHIIRNPFSSPAIYGIYAAVESIFLLSKNFYPVPLSEAHKFFTTLSGKQSEWAEKASNDAFIMYSNYAMDLGLLAKIERNYYITPAGIKFILLLELNKSILFVNSL